MMQYSQAKLRKNDCRDDLMAFVALHPGQKARIAKIKNTDAQWPITVPNPKLDYPDNWQTSFGTTMNQANLDVYKFLNDTERELTLHWQTAWNIRYCHNCSKEYSFKVSNNPACPTCGQFNITPIYRRIRTNDSDPNRWMYFWRPRDGIPYRVYDPSVEYVYVVVYGE